MEKNKGNGAQSQFPAPPPPPPPQQATWQPPPPPDPMAAAAQQLMVQNNAASHMGDPPKIGAPIEQLYNGVLYRSRLEARWAIFFEKLGVLKVFEREGFYLPSGKYLPDFYLPRHRLWVEIKGPFPTELERQKCRELAQSTEEKVILFWGELGWWFCDEDFGPGGSFLFDEQGRSAPTYLPDICPGCGGFILRKPGPWTHVCGKQQPGDRLMDYGHPATREAVISATKYLHWDPRK